MKKLFNIFILFLLSSCMEKFIIPEDIINDDLDGLSAGDTTFIKISPSWGAEFGFINPHEISIAQDGRVYIADSTLSSIFVLNQNGEKPSGFNGLLNLVDAQNIPINPTDVDIDKKMNVFFIDGSQRIFKWNQYWNDIGIKKVSTSGLFRQIDTQLDTVVNYGSDLWYSILNDENWIPLSITGEENQVMIDSLLRPHIFYDGSDEINRYLDSYYKSEMSTFSGLTTTDGSENYIFVCDNYGGADNQHRIIQIEFEKSILIELNNDEFLWGYRGKFGSTIKGYGSGAGTVNDALSIDMDYQGNIYYTQEGDFFPIHMIEPNLSGDFATYTSGFEPSSDDIMDVVIYSQFFDVSVDDNKNVYAVDKNNNKIHVFNSNGQYFKTIGSGNKPTLNSPKAVAIDNRGVVYVCSPGDSSIHRFKLSNSLDEDLETED
jgi:uncharacterized protein YjfI (DUF2170 family)